MTLRFHPAFTVSERRAIRAILGAEGYDPKGGTHACFWTLLYLAWLRASAETYWHCVYLGLCFPFFFRAVERWLDGPLREKWEQEGKPQP